MDLKKIQESIKTDNYEMSQHALERALERDIWKEDIENAIIHGEIIEEYKEDKPAIRVITIYRPDENKWIDYKRRK